MYRKVYDSLKGKCDLETEYEFDRPHIHFDSRKGSVSELIEVTGKKGDTIERAIAVNKFID